MRFSMIPFLLLAVPLLEIAAFVLVGGQIGVWATLALVVVTAVIGSFLLRWQGLSLISRIRSELAAERLPAKDLVRGAMLVIAGILLLTPGFVTDTIGFLLFVPPFQDAVWTFLKTRIQIIGNGPGAAGAAFGNTSFNEAPSQEHGQTVDLDPDDFTRNDDSSPWAGGSEDQRKLK